MGVETYRTLFLRGNCNKHHNTETKTRSHAVCGNRRVTLITNPVTSQERGKDRIVITTNGTYP